MTAPAPDWGFLGPRVLFAQAPPRHTLNPSPTRPPTIAADLGTWSHWRGGAIEGLALDPLAPDTAPFRFLRVAYRFGV